MPRQVRPGRALRDLAVADLARVRLGLDGRFEVGDLNGVAGLSRRQAAAAR